MINTMFIKGKLCIVNPNRPPWDKGITKGVQVIRKEYLKQLDKAIETNPNDIQAWFNKGITLYQLKQYKEALKCFDKTIEINPDFIKAWYNKGNTLSNLGKYKEALEAYDKTIEIGSIDKKDKMKYYLQLEAQNKKKLIENLFSKIPK